MKPIKRTKDCGLSDAEICRRNGWVAGTKLRCGHVELCLTAVGRDNVMAVWNDDDADVEIDTDLTMRNWRLA